MTGLFASLPAVFLSSATRAAFSLLVRHLNHLASLPPTSQMATIDLLRESDTTDDLTGSQKLFQEETTNLPSGLVIIFNGASIFKDKGGRWRDRASKQFVRGPGKSLEGVMLLYFGKIIVPAGFGENRWRDPQTGRFVEGLNWSFD